MRRAVLICASVKTGLAGALADLLVVPTAGESDPHWSDCAATIWMVAHHPDCRATSDAARQFFGVAEGHHPLQLRRARSSEDQLRDRT
jgi:hypothetical protein